MSAPRVELLWWEGCPSTEKAHDLLAEAMADHGLDPAAIEMCEIATDGDASRERFVGSPTIRVNGVEVAPEEGQPVGLACRVYRTRDGRTAPVPDREDIDRAIEGALA